MQPTDPSRAIERMMGEHGTQILRLCTLFLHDAALAEDAAQEVFLKAYRAYSTFRGDANEKTWLTRIAINTCKSMLRTPWHKRIAPTALIEHLPEPSTPAEPWDDSVLREVLALPPKLSEAVVLHYYHDLKVSEIAQALRLPAPTVQSRLHRARAALKPKLERWLDI